MLALDGVGQEGLTYGNDGYNEFRGERDLLAITTQIDIGKNLGLVVLCTDYCDEQEYINFSRAYNQNHGYLGFAAQNIELTAIQPANKVNLRISQSYRRRKTFCFC